MTSQPEHHRRVPRHLLVRFVILVVVVGTGFAVLRWSPLADQLSWEQISATFDRLRGTWWAPALLLGAFAVLCPFGMPPTPLLITGAVVFGAVYGSIYNIVGVFLGAATTYLLGRHLGRDFLVHLAGERLKKVERFLRRHGGFWGLVGVRFVPLPFLLVNYCAALAGIRPGLFLSATALGLALTVPIFTWFAAAIARAASGDRGGIYIQMGVALTLLILINLIPRIWAIRQRRERYRQVCKTRRLRPAPASPRPPGDR